MASTDSDKVKAIVDLTETDLMDESSNIPPPSKLKSFLGMVGFYRQYFEVYSRISESLFAQTAVGKRQQHAKNKKGSTVLIGLLNAVMLS